jgi:hypothetical protein
MIRSSSQRGLIDPLVGLAVLLGVGAAGFALLAVVFYSQSASSKSELKATKAQAYTSGKADQKAADDTLQRQLSESPFNTYTAPRAAGSFVINYPKGWSAKVDECENCGTPVDLYVSPALVRSVSGQYRPAAVHVQLVSRASADLLNGYADALSQKKLRQSATTVSGIAAIRLDGQFDRFAGSLVAVPVRDKTLLFWNEDTARLAEYNEVLAQAKVNP